LKAIKNILMKMSNGQKLKINHLRKWSDRKYFDGKRAVEARTKKPDAIAR